MTISTHTRVGPWWEIRAAGRPGYIERKECYAERLLAALERVMPGARSAVRYLQAGTPVSFQRYTRRKGGMVGGIPQRPELSGLRSLGARAAGIDHLWLVGDSVWPGQSTAAVTQAAIRVYRLLRHAPRR